MKRTTIFADEALIAEIRRISGEEDRPFAEIVREAMVEYVRARNKRRKRPKLSFIGIGESSSRDIADKHEELLWEKDTNLQS